MKRLIIILAAVLLASANLQAQDADFPKHEFGVSAGVGSNSEIIGVFADLTELIVSTTVTAIITGGQYTGHYSYSDGRYLPTLAAEYYYHPKNWIGIGGFVSFNGVTKDMYVNWKDQETGEKHKEKTGLAKRRNISIIPTVKFDWLRSRHLNLYSKVGAGATIMFQSQKDDAEDGTDYHDTDVIGNFHVSALGLEAGSYHLRCYCELGVGEQGLVLAGLKYRF